MGRLRDTVMRDDLRILAYHRILETSEPEGFEFDLELISASAAAFREQMSMIKRDFNPVRFDQVLDCLDQGTVLPPRSILVTFDDGYDDNYRVAYPILRDLDISAMFFVSTGHIESGKPYAYDWVVHMICTARARRLLVPEIAIDWELPVSLCSRRMLAARFLQVLKTFEVAIQEQALSSLEERWGMPRRPHPDCRPMTWMQLREMRRGGMEIGSHGVHHRMLAKMPTDLMMEELRQSKLMLDANIGGETRVMSYPIGGYDAFNDTVMKAVRKIGFRLACSYITGTSNLDADSLYSLRRLHVERGVDTAWFQGIAELPELFSYRNNMPIG